MIISVDYMRFNKIYLFTSEIGPVRIRFQFKDKIMGYTKDCLVEWELVSKKTIYSGYIKKIYKK